MEFCKFSSESILNNTTSVDNVFINEFLPRAPADAVKVYLYGLYKCMHPTDYNNTFAHFATELNMPQSQIEEAFAYWENEGLVSLIIGTEMQVQYLPVKNALGGVKKFNKSKYATFNKQVQALIPGRMITATEFTEYYSLIELYGIDPKVLTLIISHCTELKGGNVGYHYILTVAKNWLKEGLRTYEEILERIRSYSSFNKEVTDLLKNCGVRRAPTVEECDKFVKWTRDFGFETSTIKFVASLILEKNGKVTFNNLDSKLLGYFEARRFTPDEITDYENTRQEKFALARDVCKNLGIFYENLNIVVEKYITKWQDMGHSDRSILTLADYCFKKSIKTLDGLDSLINKLYKKGIVDETSISEYLSGIIAQDKVIKKILEALGITRAITHQDREFYKTWCEVWNMPLDLLKLAETKAAGKYMAMQYMNKILSNWFSKNITTVEAAEKDIPMHSAHNNLTQKPAAKPLENAAKLSKEELTALFDSLEEVEI